MQFIEFRNKNASSIYFVHCYTTQSNNWVLYSDQLPNSTHHLVDTQQNHFNEDKAEPKADL